jgi:hypothetical protein
MLRVVLGRARPETEWSGNFSSLQFNSAPGVQRTVPGNHYGEDVGLEEGRDSRTEPLTCEGNGRKEQKTSIVYA